MCPLAREERAFDFATPDKLSDESLMISVSRREVVFVETNTRSKENVNARVA